MVNNSISRVILVLIDKPEDSVSEFWDGVDHRTNTKTRGSKYKNALRTSKHIYKPTNIPDFQLCYPCKCLARQLDYIERNEWYLKTRVKSIANTDCKQNTIYYFNYLIWPRYNIHAIPIAFYSEIFLILWHHKMPYSSTWLTINCTPYSCYQGFP